MSDVSTTEVWAYYKGTAPPAIDKKVLRMALDIGKDFELHEANGTKKEKIAVLKTRMDGYEKRIMDHQKKIGPEGMAVPHPVRDLLIGYWGPDLFEAEMIWYRWYSCVAALLELGGIKNDDMNGWLMKIHLAPG